jgi:23S rRNA (guanosine2251-2'-O)-methyltransferase
MTTHNFDKKSMDELQRAAIGTLTENDRFNVYLVLDDVRSMNNVGSCFRTADGLNAKGIALCGVTPQPPHRDIHKTALGATEFVPWQYHQTVVGAIEQLKAEGYSIWAVEQVHNSTLLNEIAFEPEQKVALIFGNEVTGVSEEALALCDGSIEIPQWGSKHSLNIAVSVGIVLWEVVQQVKP